MAIIIENMRGPDDGECEYRLRINSQVIAYFSHSRPDGLAECLRKAADAAEKAHWSGVEAAMDYYLKTVMDRPL